MTANGQSAQGGGNFQMQVHVAHANLLTRVDIQKIILTSAGDTSGAASMMAQMLPKGTLSVLVDQGRGTWTVWSSAHRLFYQSKISVPLPMRTPKPHASSAPANNILNALSDLTKYDALSYSMNLTGHSVVNGHMASVFAFDMKSQKHGAKLTHITGTVALGDDLSGIPVHADMNVDASNTTAIVKMDLTAVAMQPPAAGDLEIPKGYTKTNNLFSVLMDSSPMTTPMRTPPPKDTLR